MCLTRVPGRCRLCTYMVLFCGEHAGAQGLRRRLPIPVGLGPQPRSVSGHAPRRANGHRSAGRPRREACATYQHPLLCVTYQWLYNARRESACQYGVDSHLLVLVRVLLMNACEVQGQGTADQLTPTKRHLLACVADDPHRYGAVPVIAGSLCAYYGARAALPDADLVLLPYGALLTEVTFVSHLVTAFWCHPHCELLPHDVQHASYMRSREHPGASATRCLLASLSDRSRAAAACGLALCQESTPREVMLYSVGAQETRQALGVHIRGNVLIVDEAHNLVDAVNNAHSAQVSAAQLRAAQGHLSGYYQRFRSRLTAGRINSSSTCRQTPL